MYRKTEKNGVTTESFSGLDLGKLKDTLVSALRLYYFVTDKDGTTIVSKQCSVTNQKYAVSVPTIDFHRWQAGAFAQDAFPNLSLEQREFLITKMTPKEQE